MRKVRERHQRVNIKTSVLKCCQAMLQLLLNIAHLEFLTLPGGSLLALEEDIMGNGQSLVLGGGLSESEGSGLGEGAAAAVGRSATEPPRA